MAVSNRVYTIDLRKPVQTLQLGVLGVGDNSGTQIMLNVLDSGSPINMTGNSVTAYMLRSDGQTVVFGGMVSSNMVIVSIPEAALAVPGAVSMAIRATIGSTKCTLVFAEYSARTVNSSQIVDPGHVVPSLDDLLARIEQMEQATAAAQAVVNTFDTKYAGIKAVVDDVNENAVLKRTRRLVQRNILNINDLVTPGFVRNDGALVTASGYSRTDYEPVEPGQTYSVWRYGQAVSSVGAGFWDKDKVYIASAYVRQNHLLTAPDNAAYIMLFGPDVVMTNNASIVCAGDIWTNDAVYQNEWVEKTYDVYGAIEKLDSVARAEAVLDDIDITPYIQPEHAFLASSGEIRENVLLNYAKVPVLVGNIYKVSGDVYSAYTLYGLMDSSGTIVDYWPKANDHIIPTSGNVPLHLEKEVVIPSGVTHMIVNKGGAWVIERLLKLGRKIGSTYAIDDKVVYPRIEERLDKLENAIGTAAGNPLWGKKLATAGTSITYGAQVAVDPETGIRMTYGAIAAKHNNMTFVNYGISGSTLQNIAGKNPFCVDRYKNMDKDLDYLTIEFGWNDHAYGVLGSLTDTVDTTYYGAWNKVLPWLVSNYPNTKIGLIVPYGTSVEMREAVRVVAKKYGLPYMDMTGDPNVPLMNNREPDFHLDQTIRGVYMSRRMADDAHPSADGYKDWATAFEAFLRSM